MMDPRSDGGPMQEALNGAEEPVTMNPSGIVFSKHGEIRDPLPGSMDEFLLDRFSTTLEDPRTGRRIR